MISKSALGTIVSDQSKNFIDLKNIVPRAILKDLLKFNGGSALVVKGVRRCGKSTILKQLMLEKYNKRFLYFNFDDERIITFNSNDFQILMEVLIGINGDFKTVLFDEIQNIKGWEFFINRIIQEGYKVFITGSNANLLSKELGTYMTGRHSDMDIYPFSFVEFLKARKAKIINRKFYSTAEKSEILNLFNDYLITGGMPEAVVLKNELVLNSIVTDIVQNDIVNRYNVRHSTELKQVISFLIANASNPITYRSILKNFEIKSTDTIQKYINYAEDTYLLFTVRKFERKIKKLDKNPKKIYCIDNGIMKRWVSDLNENNGALLENAIAIHLKRLGKEIYYYKSKSGAETDFIIPKEKMAIQVCYEITDKNKDREIQGLLLALDELNATTGIILTHDQEEEINIKKYKILIIPTWKWFIETKLAI